MGLLADHLCPAWAVAIGASIVIGFIGFFWIAEIRDWRLETEVVGEATPHSGAPAALRYFALPMVSRAQCSTGYRLLAFPIAHTRWGDALLISKALAWPDPAQRLTYSWQAPLDVFLHSQFWLHGHELFAWKNATSVYRLLSPIAGIFYLLRLSLRSFVPCPSQRLGSPLVCSFRSAYCNYSLAISRIIAL